MSSRRVVTWVCGLLLAAVLAVVPSSAAQAAVTQGIVGTVTASGGGPVATQVWLVPVDPSAEVGGGTTNLAPCAVECHVFAAGADGRFEISLPVGRYWLYFTTRGSELAPEWWQDSATREGSTEVVVTEGALTTIDPQLEPGGAVSGTVTQQPWDSSTLVTAYLPDTTAPGGFMHVAVGHTDDNGHYELSNLPPGDYRLNFVERALRLEGWWGGRTAAAATPVTVTATEPVTGIDPTLEPWGSITGRVVRASNGTPLPSAAVEALPYEPFKRSAPAPWSVTAADGTFTIRAPAGTYLLRAEGPEHQPAYWGGAGDWESAKDVAVRTAEQIPGLDFALEPDSIVSVTRTVLRGSPQVGRTISVSSSWYPSAGVSATYRWLRDGRAIPGLDRPSYTLTSADAGHAISVRILVTKAGYGSNEEFVRGVMVGLGTLRVGPVPALRGTYRVGHRIRAVPPLTAPAASASFQWLRDGRPIRQATSSTYRLRREDRGHRITARIRLVRNGYRAAVVTAERPGRVR